ncbi:unnamed protein product [Effrenium voratum]|nr:unnamed protein product [Effrenium voratum]
MIPEGCRAPPTDAVLNHLSQEFDFHEIREATQNFSASHRLGEGTYGTVFRGTLRDGTEVAIKALASPKEGGFREEVEVLSRFRHPNLVILMGFARNGRERYLVYELLPGGDVHDRLNKDASFTWEKRLNVVLDCALGLSHLHGSRPQVPDVKTQNMLMDKNGTGKVADFGLACLAQPNQRSLTVRETSGTLGYADPLYIRSGVITEKSEVYSLGMVLLEVLTGRPPALQHPNGKIEYQFEHLNGDMSKLGAMVDRRGRWPPAMAEHVGHLALQCTCEQAGYRPSFVDIVKQLRTWLRDESLHQPAVERASSGASPMGQPAGWYDNSPTRRASAQNQPTPAPVTAAPPPWPVRAPAEVGARAAKEANVLGNSLLPCGGGGHTQQVSQARPDPKEILEQQRQQQQQQQQLLREQMQRETMQRQQLQRELQREREREREQREQREQQEQMAREQLQRERLLREHRQREAERAATATPAPEVVRDKLPFPQRAQVRSERTEPERPRGVPEISRSPDRSSETYKQRSSPTQGGSPSPNGYSGAGFDVPFPPRKWQTFEGDGVGATDSTRAANTGSTVSSQILSPAEREAERERNLRVLEDLCISRDKASEALKRCSTVEAALEWIYTTYGSDASN